MIDGVCMSEEFWMGYAARETPREEDGHPLLKARSVRKTFGGNQALAGVDLTIESGLIWGLIGPNGSGKTTLFNCITGFVRIDGGSIEWRGRSIVGFPPDRLARMGLARSFQQVMAFPELTVRQCIERAKHLKASFGRGAPPNTGIPEEVDALLALGGLELVGDEVTGSLSYGMQRLVNVTMAAATRPWMLMLDEPVAGLHPSEARRLASLVRALRQAGTTPIVIDHNVSFIAGLCDRVAVIDAGKNLMEGTPPEVRADPRVIDVYLGHNSDRKVAVADV
jgi:ABC-type branched-subunit amino acid transport system ATPase component